LKQFVATAAAEKQRIAEEVASILKLSVDIKASERYRVFFVCTSMVEYYLNLSVQSPFSAPRR
jgi:hypothetical protein